MHDELTANDIKKMEDEIKYRKLVVTLGSRHLYVIKSLLSDNESSENC